MNELQLEMRRAYANGYPGIVVSGVVWLVAGTVAQLATDFLGMAALFFGGMLIVPLATIVAKQFFNAKPLGSDNPLNRLAMESTALLFAGLFIAYAVSLSNSAMFFTTMLLIIGSRYLIFQSIYGLKFFWILGALLIAAGFSLTMTVNALPSFIACYIGGGIEVLMGTFGLATMRTQNGG